MSLSQKVELKLDWCSHAAAKYAVEHWHYSKRLPVGKLAKIGAWENSTFVGVVIFGLGGGEACNGKQYGLERNFQMAELQRIALTKHQSSVSRILSICVRLIKQQSPKLRLLISFADPAQDHHGGVYQAANWFYTGRSADDWKAVWPDGREAHSRIARGRVQFGVKKTLDISGAKKIATPGKHRYLFPLDDAMRKQIELLRKPYPKRTKDQAVPHQGALGGETPTRPLHPPAPAG